MTNTIRSEIASAREGLRMHLDALAHQRDSTTDDSERLALAARHLLLTLCYTLHIEAPTVALNRTVLRVTRSAAQREP